MNDLLNTITTSYGVVVTIILLALLLIFAIITILLPVFVWGIHNQTTKATKELIKLNRLMERLRLQQSSHEGMAKQPSKDSRTEAMVEEIFKQDRKEPSAKDKQSVLPAQVLKRRKVFIKPEDKIQDQQRKL